jgi:hypothetical protein
MSDIIMPTEDPQTSENQIELTYQATEDDEEKFFLMYHMGMQPSEVDSLTEERRKWILARFIHQKNMERETIERQRIMQKIQPSLKL